MSIEIYVIIISVLVWLHVIIFISALFLISTIVISMNFKIKCLLTFIFLILFFFLKKKNFIQASLMNRYFFFSFFPTNLVVSYLLTENENLPYLTCILLVSFTVPFVISKYNLNLSHIYQSFWGQKDQNIVAPIGEDIAAISTIIKFTEKKGASVPALIDIHTRLMIEDVQNSLTPETNKETLMFRNEKFYENAFEKLAHQQIKNLCLNLGLSFFFQNINMIPFRLKPDLDLLNKIDENDHLQMVYEVEASRRKKIIVDALCNLNTKSELAATITDAIEYENLLIIDPFSSVTSKGLVTISAALNAKSLELEVMDSAYIKDEFNCRKKSHFKQLETLIKEDFLVNQQIKIEKENRRFASLADFEIDIVPPLVSAKLDNLAETECGNIGHIPEDQNETSLLDSFNVYDIQSMIATKKPEVLNSIEFFLSNKTTLTKTYRDLFLHDTDLSSLNSNDKIVAWKNDALGILFLNNLIPVESIRSSDYTMEDLEKIVLNYIRSIFNNPDIFKSLTQKQITVFSKFYNERPNVYF